MKFDYRYSLEFAKFDFFTVCLYKKVEYLFYCVHFLSTMYFITLPSFIYQFLPICHATCDVCRDDDFSHAVVARTKDLALSFEGKCGVNW